jgi:Mlc titration factor MtfA (ptsG expression regulator)
MNITLLLLLLFPAAFIIRRVWVKDKWLIPTKEFPSTWRNVLIHKVNFYSALNPEDKKLFEFEIQEFLLNCRITGIDTNVEITDHILIASSAVIPIFAFPEWKYTNLQEVLLYSDSFNDEFKTKGKDRTILGMVGTGYMSGKMILSQKALRLGFSNEKDKSNTAIHEFVHLIDKKDGATDGIPNALLSKQYAIPWLSMINSEIDAIYAGQSDINPYGATNKAEFFAVASEYFFEQPKLLSKKHPELYRLMEKVFNQKMISKVLKKPYSSIGRNDDCLCGSHIKFKYCCGAEHYS